MLKRRFLPQMLAAAVAVTIFAVLTGARELRLFQRLELMAYDTMLRVRHDPTRHGANIAIVAVGEGDIRSYDYPLRDRDLAHLLQRILKEEPRAIGLDLYRDLPEPRDGSQASELQAVLTPAENIVTIFSPAEPGQRDSGVPAPLALKALPPEERPERIAFNDFPSDGATVRRAILFLTTAEGPSESMTYSSLALRLALLDLPYEAAARGIALPEVELTQESARIGRATFQRFHGNDGGYSHTPDGGFQFLIDYRGSAEFPHWSYDEVMSGRSPKGAFRDRVVLIGGLARSIKDITPTPLDPFCSGVELHAQVVDQIVRAALEGDRPTRLMPAALHGWWTLVWAMLGSLSALALLRWPRVALPGIGAGVAALLIIKHWAFQRGWWLPLIEPGLAYVLTGGLSLLVVFAWERRQRSELMQLFSRHVSTKVAQSIWQQRETFLDGHRPRPCALTATVLFSDLVGFSSISERTPPAALMDWLNESMESLAQHVEPHGGVVNKYIGDSIMAVFGVPVPRLAATQIAADAAGAVRCALAMGAELTRLNEAWRACAKPEIGMRIGIYSGMLVAGSVGSRSRLEYTVIGDTVNTASRLESSSKEEIGPPPGSCCRILIGQSTYDLVKELFTVVPVGPVPLKGKKNAVNAYRVVAALLPEMAP